MSLSLCTTVTDLHDQELVKHGDPSFPIACYADDLNASDVPWHWHEEWEYAIVAEGTPELYMENTHFPIREGDGIFVNSRALHAVKYMADAHIPGKGSSKHRASGKLHSAVFHPRLIGGNTDSIFWQSLVQPLMSNLSTRFLVLHQSVDWERKVLQHFAAAWEAVANDAEDYENLVRYELSAAIRILIKNTDFASSGLSEQELLNAARIRTMLEYIEEHLSEDLSVELLADSASVSQSACLRCFHQMLGTTPMQYVKQLRIKKSADLLLTTNMSAKEIALLCGFNDVSYYTRSFKDTYHMTPGEFRRGRG